MENYSELWNHNYVLLSESIDHATGPDKETLKLIYCRNYASLLSGVLAFSFVHLNSFVNINIWLKL